MSSGLIDRPDITEERISELEGMTISSVQFSSVQFSSVQSLSRVELFATHESQHARPPCPSPTLRVHSDSRPSSQ